MLKYEIPVLPVTSGLRGLGRYISPLRCAYVGLSLTTSEISYGSGASPAKRSVANALIVFSEFVIDVSMLIRDYTVIVYDNAVRSTKIARVLNFMNRLSEVHARDNELIADVLRIGALALLQIHVRDYGCSRHSYVGRSRGGRRMSAGDN